MKRIWPPIQIPIPSAIPPQYRSVNVVNIKADKPQLL